MEKMRSVKKGPKRLVFLILFILSLCLSAQPIFAQGNAGNMYAGKLAFISGFQVVLIVGALMLFNFVLFHSNKNTERNTEL
ncbi:hypothetical protein IDJ77_21555 [Mucilaginibacter sp. ZT4R22]|uniref:Uncharacterized protein n=1 Tax=Mucilaginibacter pankratovii TaxID=2772110 RepID=A0ABR7WVW0_9SPHI|nr:hypothetical protein [Mucilaginibacter pankratovii]MBD1366414.1 hypothetical protein [Mucilaginibacter pankratovii]